MNQVDFQTCIKEKFGSIPDSLEEYNNVSECRFLADKLSFMGYGQNAKGYCEIGVRNPSQKFHLVTAYFDYKFKNKDTEKDRVCDLSKIHCLQLILWIAEIVQVKEELLKTAYDCIVKEENKLFYDAGRKKEQVGASQYWSLMERYGGSISENDFKKMIKYNRICDIIKEEESWNRIIEECGKI